MLQELFSILSEGLLEMLGLLVKSRKVVLHLAEQKALSVLLRLQAIDDFLPHVEVNALDHAKLRKKFLEQHVLVLHLLVDIGSKSLSRDKTHLRGNLLSMVADIPLDARI